MRTQGIVPLQIKTRSEAGSGIENFESPTSSLQNLLKNYSNTSTRRANSEKIKELKVYFETKYRTTDYRKKKKNRIHTF